MALTASCQALFIRTLCRRAQFSASVIQGSSYDVQKRKPPDLCCLHVLSPSQQNHSTGPANLQTPSKITQIKSLNYSPACNRHINMLYKYRNTCNGLQQNLHKSYLRASFNTLGRSRNPILQVCDKNQHSHSAMSSLSPAQLLLESCPAKVQPYLRLIRFEKPIGKYLLL